MFEENSTIYPSTVVDSENQGWFWGIIHAVEKMRFVLAILLVGIVFSSVTLQAASPSASGIENPNSQAKAINPADIFYIEQINQVRLSIGKKPLDYSAVLEKSAALKARDMVANNYWGHYGPNGESFSDFIWRQSPDSQKVGENLARCFVTRDSAFKALVASPTHYDIMVGDFTNIGVSELTNVNDGCVYAVFHFAKNQPI
ncbi:CAP domain-containing protein [Candidatus Saccharibacteria bacterium]|nr:CAP domain-containing protein [Candidatus Saccharibacteria bacterium]MBP7834600.1 CAP domain-containing protein [Candidatus Saccharibacteria bacterium]